MNDNEPRYHTTQAIIGDGIRVQFKGEQFKGLPILDTAVTINGEPLCAITWEERFHFVEELEKVIDKYKI